MVVVGIFCFAIKIVLYALCGKKYFGAKVYSKNRVCPQKFSQRRESKKNLKICGWCVKMRNSLIQFFEGSFGGFEGIKL